MRDYVCEPLGKQHDRTQFDCGITVLNDYLSKYANQDVKRKALTLHSELKNFRFLVRPRLIFLTLSRLTITVDHAVVCELFRPVRLD